MGNSHKNLLVWNQLLNWNQTLIKYSLDGPLPKLCLAVTLSHHDGHQSAVALLLKAALIQVSDYRLLGASGFVTFRVVLLHFASFRFVWFRFVRFHLVSISFRTLQVPTQRCKNGCFCYLYMDSLLVHLDQRWSRWTIPITLRPSSVNFSHFKPLLRNHWADWNQT